jgi:hypothetical protein
VIGLVRPWREEVKGGYYHVIARGNNREYIFKKDIDKGYFLKLLNESRQTMRYKLIGYVLRVEDYKWSSDKFYRKKLNGFIETRTIHEMIEKGFKESDKKYIEIMDEIEETDYETLNEIGEKAYEIMLKSSITTGKRPSLDEILAETVGDANIAKLIIKGTRESKYKEYKLKYAEKAQGYGYTLREIGAYIGQSGNSIWKLLRSQ